MNNPEYIDIDGKRFKINTDYRNVLRLEKIANDKTIDDYERILGIIYMFYGEEGYNSEEYYDRLLNGIITFCKGRPNSINPIADNKREKDMDYTKDMNLIISSMWNEYGIDITKEKIHWWTFFDLLNGLSSECALNRVRDIRTKDLSKVKDKAERDEYARLKGVWALSKEDTMTEEQKQSVDAFYESLVVGKEVK